MANNCKVFPLGKFNKAHPSQGQTLNRQTESVQYLRRYLCESLKLRILKVPLPPGSADGHDVRVAVLFSGKPYFLGIVSHVWTWFHICRNV
jgi:hypothetical protein